MKMPIAVLINIVFRIIVSLAYGLLGIYVAFFSEFNLGDWFDLPITFFLGILFITYGLFRLWRAYAYYRELNEDDYGKYE